MASNFAKSISNQAGIYKDRLTRFGREIGKDARKVRDELEKKANKKFGDLVKETNETRNLLKPVYRIAITFPIDPLDDSPKNTRTVIIADNTTSKKTLGMGVSELIGMWIDEDDVQEPDKSICLFRVDPELSERSFGKDYQLDESAFLDYKTFSVRHWLDIWIGYERQDNIGASTRNTIISGVRGVAPTGLNLLTQRLGVDTILPEAFTWYGETHIFSGPIVAILRNINSSGDRLTMIAYSGEIMLKNLAYGAKAFTNHHKFSFDESPSFTTEFKEFIEKVRSFKEYESSGDREKFSNEHFVMGNFYFSMFSESLKVMKQAFGGASGTAVSSVGATASAAFTKGQNPPLLDPYTPNELILNGGRKMRAPIIAEGNPITFWDVMQTFLDVKFSGIQGVNVRATKGSRLAQSVYSEAFANRNIAKEGDGQHPGFFLQFYFMMEIDDTLKFINDGGTPNTQKRRLPTASVSSKDLSDQLQILTLGHDIIDMEVGINYSGVFNTLKFSLRTPITPIDPQAGIDVNRHILDTKKGHTKIFPTQFESIMDDTRRDGLKFKDFWTAAINDIRMFGEQRYPLTKWFTISTNELKKVAPRGAESVIVDVDVDPDGQRTVIDEADLMEMYKRYYFGGLEGQVFTLGNPKIKVSRLLHIRDKRSVTSGIINKALQFQVGVPKSLTNLVSSRPLLHPMSNRLSGYKGLSQISGETSQARLQLAEPARKFFYIWKVRHYFGAGSGYLTKLYYTESRSRAWKTQSKDILGTIREATQRIRREFKS